MPTNIESFVKTLESEGVDAGKKAAQKIEADAREQAKKIISESEVQAKKIIDEADKEAEQIRSRMNSSLELATRDAILLLREKLSQQIQIILELSEAQIGFIHYTCFLCTVCSTFQNFHNDIMTTSSTRRRIRHITTTHNCVSFKPIRIKVAYRFCNEMSPDTTPFTFPPLVLINKAPL